MKTEKYNTWEWNYGSSPQYNMYKAIRTKAGTLEFYLNVAKGKIDQLRVFGDFFGRKELKLLEDGMKGIAHKEDVVLKALQELDVPSFFGDVSAEEILEALF